MMIVFYYELWGHKSTSEIRAYAWSKNKARLLDVSYNGNYEIIELDFDSIRYMMINRIDGFVHMDHGNINRIIREELRNRGIIEATSSRMAINFISYNVAELNRKIEGSQDHSIKGSQY